MRPWGAAMGNGESAVVRNVDKRTSRREHRAGFEAAVQRFRRAPFAAPERRGADLEKDRFVRVCVRKRPIFSHELEQSEFDVVTCLPGRVVVHDARMHPDMVHMFMNHHDFGFDEAFGENVGNDEVYEHTAKDLVKSTLEGHCSTVMMYGQTGSGKTFTMSAIYDRVVEDIFAGFGGRTITTSFVELSGDKCFDMLNAGQECKLSQAADGSVHPFPCVEVEVKDGTELLGLIRLAAKLRVTAATGVHDQSSRSHAVCRIYVDGLDAGGSEGTLTLVDLAGSEQRNDSAEHNAERRKEGAKINASLAALKDCIRAASRGSKFVNFRQNRLTQMLRSCFSRLDGHQTVVIATVSPSSKDTEHSMNTLRHACIMDGQGEQRGEQSAHMAGGVVTKEVLGEIDVTRIARERRASAKEKLPDDWGKHSEPPAHQSKQSNLAARAALDRKALRSLPSELQEALLASRAEFGSDRQRRRIGRAADAAAAAEVDAAAAEEVRSLAAAAAERERPPVLCTCGNRFDAKARFCSICGAARQPVATAAAAPAAAVPVAVNAEVVARGLEAKQNRGGCQGHGLTSPTRATPELGIEALSSAVRAMGPEGDRAFELFKEYVTSGRSGRDWRKNDLRMINACVLPVLFSDGASIEWNHVCFGLDQLDTLLQDRTDVRAMLQAGSTAAAEPRPSRPPRVPSAGAPGGGGGVGAVCSGYPAESGDVGGAAVALPAAAARRRNSGQSVSSPASVAVPASLPVPRRVSDASPGGSSACGTPCGGRPSSSSFGGGSCSQEASTASTAMGRSTSAPSSASSQHSNSSHRHADAVRARREAMEKARKESLQQALEKKEPPPERRPSRGGGGGPDAEIAALEEQIASGRCSDAALVGLKKRVAALKATAIREQRAAEARRRAAEQASQATEAARRRPAAEPQVPQQQPPSAQRQPATPQGHCGRPSSTPWATSPDGCSGGGGGGTGGRWGDGGEWPEPAVPPPRGQFPPDGDGGWGDGGNWRQSAVPQSRGQFPSDCRLQAELMAVAASRKRMSPVGAAAAPWGNAFTDD